MVIDELKRDLHASDTEAYVCKLAPGIAAYPPVFDWRFTDEFWTTPDAFETLLAWMPDVAHDKHGFFKLAGIRSRPDRSSGFLNVADYVTDFTEETPQHWEGVVHHPLPPRTNASRRHQASRPSDALRTAHAPPSAPCARAETCAAGGG